MRLASRPIDRRAWWALAAGVPTVLLFWVGACFVWNSFYVSGPYLHDAGWYSSIIWRQGIFPHNPVAADHRPEYFAVHVSPLVSVASLLSYLFPGDRVTWYVLFQGVVYAPLGLVTATLVGSGRRTLGDAAIACVVSLAFALNGEVWACLGYPHYEIVIPIGLALMLGGLATGRVRLAWIGLAIAAATREDGGLHTASFAAAVLACDLTKRPFPVPRRVVVQMLAVSIGASALMFVVQKVGFHSAGLFRHEYVGDVPFAHLTSTEIRARLVRFSIQTRFILFPLLATAALAIARRDARLLLGWGVELHWLLLNFLAAQELKATFGLYTGFPFVASIFWVAAYDRATTPAAWRRPLALLALVSVATTVGSWSSNAPGLRAAASMAFVPGETNAEGLRAFARVLRADPYAYGSLYADPSMTAWALERWPARPVMWLTVEQPYEGYDGMTFFRNGLSPGPGLPGWLARSPYSRCGRLVGTEVYLCTTPERPLPPELTPSSPLLRSLVVRPEVARREGERVDVRSTPGPEVALFGPFIELDAGPWAVVWTTRFPDCAAPGPLMHLDVFAHDHLLALREISAPENDARLEFELPQHTDALELRVWTGACPFTIDGVRLEAR